MSATRQELILSVDWDIIDACNGFTFDMGGSVMKIVFVDKNDWVEPSQRKPGSKGNLHMVNFSRSEIHLALDFILERVRITESLDGSSPYIYSTGIGGSQYSQDILDKLHVKNKQLVEFDCFNVSFMHLVKNLPRKDVLYPIHRPAFEFALKKMEVTSKMMQNMKGKSDFMDALAESANSNKFEYAQLKESDLDKPLEADGDLFPCGIMMCGSAFALSKIQSDGSSTVLRISSRGGKMLLGLGSILAETENFEELMQVCEKGNQFNVTTSHQAVLGGLQSIGKNDMYAAWGEMSQDMIGEEVAFSYGKAAGKKIGDFKREDLARCILETHVSDMATMVYPAAIAHGLKHIFFCGGFVNHPLVRQVVTEQWLNAGRQMSTVDPSLKGEVQIHFLIHAQSLGALGAILNHKLQWSEKNPNKQYDKDSHKSANNNSKQDDNTEAANIKDLHIN